MSPGRTSLASWKASRRSFFTRFPGGRSSFDGAATWRVAIATATLEARGTAPYP
jgi:hypothetical protein